MSDKNTLGIFEAGISQPDEMERLQPIIAPTIGVITNIGEAHQENLFHTEMPGKADFVQRLRSDHL